MSHLQFHSVSFTYDSLSTPLINDLSFAANAGWTGVVGPNGIGKSTVLRLACRQLAPERGHVVSPHATLLEQRTDDPPEGFIELLSFPDADAGRLVSVLGVEADWPYRWETLSHGERKRAQLAVALHQRPELLAVDEPTNHLDADARRMVRQALLEYEGIGVIVSHDRALLDALCSQCLFLSRFEEPVMRPGGVSEGLEQERHDRASRAIEYEHALATERRVVAEERRRRSEASVERQNKKRSKRGLSRRDSDAREKIDRARISGADGNAGRSLNQMSGRVAQARAAREALERPVRERVGVTLPGDRSESDRLIELPAQSLPLGPERTLTVPQLRIEPSDRIGLIGPNGAGKSTLVRQLTAAGRHLDRRMVFVPQELPVEAAERLRQEVLLLQHSALARVLSTVSRLGSDPEKIRESGCTSPGEARKLMLALGFEHNPQLVIMDEPTNHLDLVSIECLEKALAEFAGALLLVSHDERFLETLTHLTWEIRESENGSYCFTL